jgi:hypothetical protein
MNRFYVLKTLVVLCSALPVIIFSCKKTIPGDLPTVITKPISSIQCGQAQSGGIITSDGDNPITSRGVCWSTKPYPTINDNKTTDAAGTGEFYSQILNLEPLTTYYLRAYAENKKGVSYGLQETFQTTKVTLGDYYQGGVIVYISKSGDKIFSSNKTTGIVANIELKKILKWGCSGIFIDSTFGSIGDGDANTVRIVKKCNNTIYAAKYCANLNANGYNDWFLPSADEFSKVRESSVLNTLNENFFWTSSEAGTGDAFVGQRTSSSMGGYFSKEIPCAVFPIRYFSTL